MECTVTLDERLLDEARRLLGTESVKDTLEASLRTAVEVARRKRESQFEAFLNRVEFDLTDEELHRWRYSEFKRSAHEQTHSSAESAKSTPVGE